jgi:EPS-associated MarR family transcriptional regulator
LRSAGDERFLVIETGTMGCYSSTIEQHGTDRAVAMKKKEKNNKDDVTEDELDVMWLIDKHPTISQRQMADLLGMSLGKVNYCLSALVEVGFVKLGNFNRSNSKMGYLYVLTTKGVKAKLEITQRFLKNKQLEFDKLYNYLND